ncbi:hypothetical protein C100_07160 [Sphingobium sp. C100]|uniref:hypothetical protein n=1 Tax=Sphingobium sp. C100 TaxID=1207055 RepID=UPI0003D697E0|nr:hypothetical protein [Sphingobium sp. C100]ETI64467.1 hypothetical protein C100_07160 [Sphingobium sp. C100]
MADLYAKALTSERRALWAECRLKGLARDTPQRLRIVEIDALLAAHKAKQDGAKQDGAKQDGAKQAEPPQD